MPLRLFSLSAHQGWLFALVTLIGTFIQFTSLSQTPFANGWDGYFYLVQFTSLYETGSMHAPDASLIYPILVVVYAITGKAILSFKLVSALLAGLFAGLFFLIGRKWGNHQAFGLLLAGWALFSPHLSYFTAQFPKNLLGLDLFLLLLLTLNSKPAWPSWLLVGLNFLGHRLTFVLAALVFTATKVRVKRIHLFLGLGAIAVLVVTMVLFPGVLHWSDLERFTHSLHSSPQWAYWSFYQQFGPEQIALTWKVELILSQLFLLVGVILLLVPAWRKFTNQEQRLLLALFPLLLFPYLVWSPQEMAPRLFHLAMLLSPLLIPWWKLIGNKWIPYGLAATLAAFNVAWLPAYNPQLHDPPNKIYALAASGVKRYFAEDPPELIIAGPALAPYITYYTGIHAMAWEPEYEIPKEKLWRIASGLPDLYPTYYLSREEAQTVKRLGLRHHLIREDLWQNLLKKIEESEGDEMINRLNNWENPHHQRPGFLLRNKGAEK